MAKKNKINMDFDVVIGNLLRSTRESHNFSREKLLVKDINNLISLDTLKRYEKGTTTASFFGMLLIFQCMELEEKEVIKFIETALKYLDSLTKS